MFRFGVGVSLDRRTQPVNMEFMDQARGRRSFHFLLVQRLHGGEPGGGARY
jgi:hypothetical protein